MGGKRTLKACRAQSSAWRWRLRKIITSAPPLLSLAPPHCRTGLPGAEQRIALAAAPRGHRKIIVATNIAETSLTLEGVVYVVDSCFVKQRCYNPLLGLESLLIAPTSKVGGHLHKGWASCS